MLLVLPGSSIIPNGSCSDGATATADGHLPPRHLLADQSESYQLSLKQLRGLQVGKIQPLGFSAKQMAHAHMCAWLIRTTKPETMAF